MSLTHFPEHREIFANTQPPDPGSLTELEEQTERDWQTAMSAVQDFASTYGWAATMRMIGAVISEQPELFRR